LSTCISLAVLEIALRLYERWLARSGQDRGGALALLEPNPHGTGSYRLKPNQDLYTRVGSQRIHISTNRFGMRWREVPVSKPAGKRRIAFMGDSFVFGCWSSGIETSLVGVFERAISPVRFEVLNFGVGGYGPADLQLQLDEEVARFEPDFVIVVFFAGNDFRDAHLGIDKAEIVNGTAQLRDANVRARVPDSDLPNDGTLSKPSPEGPWRKRLRGLATYRFLAPFLGSEALAVDLAVNRNFTMFTYWSQFPYPPVALQARDETLAIFESMGSFLRERRARLAIVAMPYMEQVYSRELAGRGFDVSLPQLYVQAFARERGIPYLDLLPMFRKRVQARNERLYIKGDVHLNDAGHRLAGEAIVDWFRCCVKD
jgi:lysophospholipase L1-like esterase